MSAVDFVTMDFEYADRILPSICSMTIFHWYQGKVVKTFDQYINPDCEIEDFFIDRHGITNEMVKDSPTLPQLWKEIYEMLDNKLIFMHYANRSVVDLQIRAMADYLNMPDFVYGDTVSLTRRTWSQIKEFKLVDINKELKLTDKDYDSYHDAFSVAKIVYKSMKKYEVVTIPSLFNKVGYAGGFMLSQNKISYRAVKREGEFIPRIKLPDQNFGIINRLGDIEIVK